MKKIAIIFIVLFITFVTAHVALGDDPTKTGDDPKSSVSLTNPIGSDDVPSLIGNIIKGVLGVVGSLALLMFIYGGFMWMLSGGNDQMIDKGKKTLTWAALGLIVIFMSYALVSFVLKAATGG